MLALNAKQNGIRILFPREFLHPDVEEKYTKILQKKRSFFSRPIDFINETIQKVEVLGFREGSLIQRQTGHGYPITKPERIEQNRFMHTQSDHIYRSEVSPLELVDKTINIDFRHTLGYMNYIILFENFWYIYARDTAYKEMLRQLHIDLFDELGELFCRIAIDDPIIDSMDMLSLDYSQPITNISTFRMIFKYSNFDFEFPDRYTDDTPMPVNIDTGNGSQIILDEC